MTLWFVFALMAAAAIFAVLWPLGRRVRRQAGSDLEVYRDQLDEIERDRAAGRIEPGEAEAARTEVSRRLIAAADTEQSLRALPVGSPLWRRCAVTVGAVILLPSMATALYLALGSPQLPGRPLAERVHEARQGRSIENLVSQAEAHLERNPNDIQGYEVLAPVYLRLGRFADAVNARRKLLALGGENAGRQSDLGEALVAAANGIVTTDAKSAFERALVLDANELKAKFYIGLAAEQDGDRARAAAIWRAMIKDAPADAPWRPMVEEALARLDVPSSRAAGPGPTADDIAAAAAVGEKERGEMIRKMVASLADRLKENESDVEGWQRLLRAYIVLGEREKALSAASAAKRALANDVEKLRRIEETIKTLGLEG